MRLLTAHINLAKRIQPADTGNYTLDMQRKERINLFLMGSLSDLRVNYYKHLAKDKTITSEEQQTINVRYQAIKVILNASYGVMGAEIFPLYCLPVADATAKLEEPQ